MSNKSNAVAWTTNPFKPSFGSRPPVIVGRNELIHDLRLGFDEGPGSPNRAMTVVGPRGIGKTVLLEEMNEVAKREGWISVSATTGAQMLTDILDQIEDAAKRKKISFPFKSLGVNVLGFGGSATLTDDSESKSGWRFRIQKVLDTLDKHETGLFVTIDEVHPGVPELEYFCKAVQHLVRQGRNIAVVFAGLPEGVKETAKTPGLTFIWRAERKELSTVPLDGVQNAFDQTIHANGRTATAATIRAMADATQGYPFMIQLVGYHTWRHGTGKSLTMTDVKAGASDSRRRIGTSVSQYALADISGVAREFLASMARDEGPSKMGDIATRMGVTPQYVSVYRAKLIDAGIIKSIRHGTVAFAIPYLRDYLQDNEPG